MMIAQIEWEVLTADFISRSIPKEDIIEGQIIVVCNQAIHLLISSQLEDDYKYVVTITDCSNGMLPNGIMVQLPGNENFKTLGFKTGNNLSWQKGFLKGTFGAPLIKITSASGWMPDRFDDINPAHPLSIKDCIEETLAICLANLQGKGGFTFLLSLLKDIFAEHCQIVDLTDPFKTRALKSLLIFTDGIRQHQYSQIIKGLNELIGLGPGLTPSGDDFIIGTLAGVSAVTKHFGNPSHILDLQRWIQPSLRGRTTAVSETFLFHAVRNEFPERVTDLVKAIVEANKNILSDKLMRTIPIGSSSGFDLTIGILVGVEIGLKKYFKM